VTPLPQHPALRQLASVARALGNLKDRVVFIGGALSPLLQVDPPFPAARPTADVDAVIATASYAAAQRIEETLRARGFRQDPGAKAHAHRWVSPDGVLFDLVPAGEHFGGTGSPWDQLVIASAVETALEGGLTIRHASAPGFLALKWAAFNDRGRDDPLHSDDLEDIVALLASRPSLVAEVEAAPEELRAFVRAQASAFLTHPFLEDLLAAYLSSAQSPARLAAMVREILERMAQP